MTGVAELCDAEEGAGGGERGPERRVDQLLPDGREDAPVVAVHVDHRPHHVVGFGTGGFEGDEGVRDHLVDLSRNGISADERSVPVEGALPGQVDGAAGGHDGDVVVTRSFMQLLWVDPGDFRCHDPHPALSWRVSPVRVTATCESTIAAHRIERVFELEYRRRAGEIRVGSDRLRELARAAAPGAWRMLETDGGVRVTNHDGQEVAALSGVWAPGTARYLTTFGPDTGFLVAELMWRCQSVVRRGELPAQIEDALLDLAHAVIRQ